jgi:hypothetical protein
MMAYLKHFHCERCVDVYADTYDSEKHTAFIFKTEVRLLDTGEFIWGQEKNQAKHN